MKRLTILAALALAGCNLSPPATAPVPVDVADTTSIDERAAMGFELAYAAARTLAELAVDTGHLKGANAAKVQTLNRQAYNALLVARTAYRTGNSASWSAAFAEGRSAIDQINALVKGS